MPYERGRTLIQMAPRSLTRAVIRPRGMGQDQTTTVTLPNVFAAPTASGQVSAQPYTGGAYTTLSTAGGDYQLVSSAPGQATLFDPTGNVVGTLSTAATAGAQSLSTFLSSNSGILLGVGGLLFALAIVRAMR